MTQTQKNRKKNNRMTLSGFAPVIVMLIAMVFMLIIFGKDLIKKSCSHVGDEYMRMTEEIEDAYSKDIGALEYLSRFVGNVVSEQNDIFNSEIQGHLKHTTELEDVFNMYVVKPDLSAMDAEGNLVDNITAIPGYEDIALLDGKNKFITNMYGQRVLLIVTPLSKGTENKGYLIVEYAPSGNKNIQVKGAYALVDENGNVIETGGEKTPYCEADTNIIDKLSSATFKIASKQSLSNAILQNKQGKAEIADAGIEKHIYYYPLENCNASIVMFVNTSDVRMSEQKATADIKRLVISMSCCVIAVIVFLIGFTIYSMAKLNLESDDLKNKADTDQLTQLYNKMATQSKIQEYIENEGKDSVSMFFILDVDDFKKINDTMGHAFGDKVLVSLGNQIRSWFRMNDIIGRIGGDEFIIFVKDVKNEEIIKKEGNRILQFFSGFTVGEYTRYAPTASIGCSIYPRDGKDFETLYKSADQALYKSKKGGKNQLTFYSDVETKNDSEQE